MSNKANARSTASDPDASETLALGVLDTFVGYHLRRSSAVFAADFNRVIGEIGLRQVPFAVLTMVARHPGVNQGAIGEALGIQRANMVALVGDLIAQGLIERAASSGDRRAFALSITPKGEKLVARCLDLLERHEEALLTDFTAQERKTLIALLGRIEAKEG